MKKYFIILLAVLLLFSFTSCSKDKSEEVRAEYEEKLKAEEEKQASIVKNYEDFCEAYKAAEFIWNLYSYGDGKISANGTYQINTFGEYNLHVEEARYLVTLSEGTASDSVKVDFTSGTVEVDNYGESYFYSNKDLEFKDNKLTVKYKIEGDSEEKSADITLRGTLSVTVGATEKTVAVNLAVGDKTYIASWTLNYSSSPSKFTKATVNGQEVEVRLLNRAINFGS